MRGNIDTINLHSWFDCTRCFTVLPVRVNVFLTGRVLIWECCLCIYASMNEFLFVFFVCLIFISHIFKRICLLKLPTKKVKRIYNIIVACKDSHTFLVIHGE